MSWIGWREASLLSNSKKLLKFDLIATILPLSTFLPFQGGGQEGDGVVG